MTANALLELKDVHTHIGAYHILHGVDLSVPASSVTMLLGRNGAGKTTTLRTIMGLWRASHGQVCLEGKPIGGPGTRTSPPDMARMGMAYVPENMGIFGDLSVKENILLAARHAKTAAQLDTARLEWIFGFFPALKKFWLHPAGKLSGAARTAPPPAASTRRTASTKSSSPIYRPPSPPSSTTIPTTR